MKNKRGLELLHENVFTIIILLFIFVALLYFINQQATGKLIEKQALAKEVCLLSLASKPGTNILIEHDSDLVISKQDNGIIVNDKQGAIARGYFYDCYGNFELNSIEEGKTEMFIS
jgi:hypothetical protein